MINIEGVLWTEKYRPKTLEDIALPEDDRKFIEQSLAEGGIPHLLLSGPPGIGKTTLAYILENELDCQSLVLNASKDRGIDTIRDRVGNAARSVFGARWNLVILDEADALTREAQNSLRNLMETYSEHCRFILTANYPHKISAALRSRCHELELSRLEVRDRFNVLADILDAEGLSYLPEGVADFAKRYTDLRKMINAAQRSFLAHGELVVPPDFKEDAEEVLQAIKSDDWSKIVKISKKSGMDHERLMEKMFWEIKDGHPNAPRFRYEIAKAVHESTYTPDPVVHFLGLCANLIR